ncbi:MAG: crossover junction endodeoxyribonuclease RuvC [Candidatus Colwellbacteria bacterium RIFCSPLOWO2_01_FULL_48_10]|uniref:Crossover junction endodeoxyribonuclease RuvC n=2 Tax=Bacteria candidate phyla TaxID=1783234 RepID=A0A1F5P470_9BACT|nr:MAG: crossover junction endodeoxyribonuclease RuvC [Candidatus Doudnabacteria bacterium RIFCSPHIGHO2_01_FULL_49_9]OGY59378.1 MAG: crossover junction endodeoxyribonuclease RuvC [Candidatus Colwellbacteria bacterium RIFCSPLOWO2_01_FULL_48_10]
MVIIGIDPGTTAIGYGVIEKNGAALKPLAYGVIETSGNQAEKLMEVDRRVAELIKKYKPELAAVETLYFSTNKKTAIAVAEARGVITLAVKRAGIRLMEFSPNNVKSVVTGDGQADKQAVEKIVCLTLNIKKFGARDDAADALALAIRGAAERIVVSD